MWTILFAILPAIGVAEFSLPALTGPVVDEARLLSPDTRARLDRFLQDLRVRGGSQIQVVTLRSLSGHSIEEAGIKLAEAWKLGGAKQDDGVIVVLAPTERRVRIEVGQGREGELPDVVASRIIREVIVPRMREGDADGAVRDGVLAIVHYTDPDFAREAGVDRKSVV